MISVVAGVYNEEEVLPAYIKTFFGSINFKEDYELIFVDDGSTDQTKEVILNFKNEHPQIKLVSYQPNKGLGNALRTAFSHAGGRIIVTTDVDLAHHPMYIHKLVNEVDKGYDLAIGSRYAKGGGIIKVPFQRKLLSKLTNLVMRILIITSIKDLTNGFRAYNSAELKKIKTKEKGFEIEVEIVARFLRRKAKIKEIPVRALVDRVAGKSKFNFLKESLSYMSGLARVFVYRWI